MPVNNRPRLDSILPAAGSASDIDALWDATEAAPEMGPLPAGRYRALLADGYRATSKTKGTPSYKLVFDVVEPAEHRGRHVWHDLWLTPNAITYSKRALAKLGFTTSAQLHGPPPRVGIMVELAIALRDGGNGTFFNQVNNFTVIDEGTPADALAPTPDDLADDGRGGGR